MGRRHPSCSAARNTSASWPGAAAHLDRYGLVSPDTVIRIGVAGGVGGVVVRLGDRTPDGGENYAQKDDDPGVYLIDSTWGEALTKLVREPPYQTLWSTESEVNAVNVEHRGSEQTWALDDEGVWRFDSPEGDPVDEERWQERTRPPDRHTLPLRDRGGAGEPRRVRPR